MRIGRLGAKILAHMNPGQGYAIDDFIPHYEPPKPRQTEGEMKQVARSVFGTIEKRLKGTGNGKGHPKPMGA